MKITMICCALFILTACNHSPTPATNAPAVDKNMQSCPKERPQMCTKIYKPVCATRDTGVRCVTTPCPSTEVRTYGNDCTACADEKVIGYVHGECVTGEKQD